MTEGGVVVLVVGGFGDGEALDEAAVGEGFDVGVLGCLHGVVFTLYVDSDYSINNGCFFFFFKKG